MNFVNEKKQALEKLVRFDNSKKGFIDKDILELVTLINKHQDYYTTSSCAGRIMLIKPSKLKHEANWIYSSHDPADLNDLLKALEDIPKGIVWLRMEPPILHVACRNMEAAADLLKKANAAGFRRPSVLSFEKRIIVEIMMPYKMDVPITKNRTLLADKEFLLFLIEQANLKLKNSRKKLRKLEEEFKKEIKKLEKNKKFA